ncbi:MAG: exosortase U [Planctomycetota bacterium]
MLGYALAALSVAAVATAYGPLLVEFSQNLWDKPYYQHFPFVLFASGWLAWEQVTTAIGQASDADKLSNSWRSVAAYVAAVLLRALAYQAYSPMITAASFIFLIGGWGLSVTRRLRVTFPTGPWLLLFLLIPPPLQLDARLIEALQRSSSRLASQTLDLIGANHLMDGNALVLPEKELFVDEACSGIVSVISIVACAAIYGVWRRRSGLHVLLQVAAAAGWATLMNVVRITAIALAEVWGGLDWTVGTPHTLVAVAAFSISVVALVATDWLLHALLAGIGARWAQMTGEPLRFGTPIVAVWDWFAAEAGGSAAPESEDRSLASALSWRALSAQAGAFSLGVAPVVAFAGLGATQLAMPRTEVEARAFTDSAELAQALQDELMPKTLAGLTLVDVEHDHRDRSAQFGEHSVIFTYEDAEVGASYRVSCDFPFPGGWHELAVCYQGIGWRLEDRFTKSSGDAVAESPYKYSQLRMTKPDGSRALVSFCACLENGEAVAPPDYGFFPSLFNALTGQRQTVGTGRQSFQAQVLAVRPEGITDRDRRVSAELLDEARRRFVRAAVAYLPAGNP